MNIILLAPPAAGKGTQEKFLENEYHLNHLSTGDLLRQVAREDSELGQKVKETLSNGNLVSDEIIFQLIDHYMAETKNHQFLFDGFPRNILQAQTLDDILSERCEKIDAVFLLDVTEECLKKRITGRRLCKNCGAIYNVTEPSLKPKNESICDKCGHELYQREDDKEKSFEIRYREYKKQTEPLIEYYRKQNKLYSIDSMAKAEEVFHRITSIIEKEMIK